MATIGVGPQAYAFVCITGFTEGALAALAGDRGTRDGAPGGPSERPRLALGPAALGGVRKGRTGDLSLRFLQETSTWGKPKPFVEGRLNARLSAPALGRWLVSFTGQNPSAPDPCRKRSTVNESEPSVSFVPTDDVVTPPNQVDSAMVDGRRVLTDSLSAGTTDDSWSTLVRSSMVCRASPRGLLVRLCRPVSLSSNA